jgi:hypothetical protein
MKFPKTTKYLFHRIIVRHVLPLTYPGLFAVGYISFEGIANLNKWEKILSKKFEVTEEDGHSQVQNI